VRESRNSAARFTASGGAENQVGDGVAKPWRRSVLATTWWLGPSGSFWRESVEQCVEFAVDIATRIRDMRSYEENAGSMR
jgi:hypothetical protein